MKVNQLLLSVMFLFSFAHNTVQASQAVKAIKGAATAAGFVGRIMTNRANPQEEQIFMAVNAGAKLLELINGLLKTTPTEVVEGQSPTFMQTLAIAVSGHATIGDALRTAGQQNLDNLVTWFKTKQVTELIKSFNPAIDEHLSLEEQKNTLTPEQKKQVEKFESTFEKASGPAVRLLKGTSKPYERFGVWLVLKVVSLINGFRNKFTSGRKLDDTSTMITEATAFATEQGVNTAFRMVERGLEYAQQTAQGGLEFTGNMVQAGREMVNTGVEATRNVLSNMLDAVNERATNLLESLSGGRAGIANGLSTVMNWFNGPEDHFIDAAEISATVLALLTDPEKLTELLEEILPEEYAQTLQDVALDIRLELQVKGTSQQTIDLLFSNIDKIMEETTLRKIDLTDFSKLPDPLKAKIIDAWKNAQSKDLIEVLVNLQAKGIDKTLLEVIGKNTEWEKLKAEELIQIPETLYDFLSLTVLIEIKKVLQATAQDFDTINKLTALSLAEENAFKRATPEELLKLPSELYKEMPKEALKKLQEQLLLKDAQLTPEELLNDPYGEQLKLIEGLLPSTKTTTDSQSIQQQATAAKTKQETAIAQKTTDTTSTTQTTPDKTAPATQNGTTTNPQTTDNTGQNTQEEDIFYDAVEMTPEQLKKYEEEQAVKKAQEEKIAQEKAAQEKAIEAAQAEHTAPAHGL